MQIPIVGVPTFIEELSEDFLSIFPRPRQLKHFKRLMAGFILSDRHTIAHMNGLFVEHPNQSSLNRFITHSPWNEDDVHQQMFKMINKMENGEGTVILDDYITEKTGKHLYGTNYHFDHAKGHSVFGQQIADCVYSGNGIYPLLSSVYVRKDSHWGEGDFKTKIELQKEHLSKLIDMGLNFETVVIDSWYCSKDLLLFIESLGKDYVVQSKSNRKILSRGEWVSLNEFARDAINSYDFRVILLGDNKYFMKAFTVTIKGLGKVRLLISTKDGDDFKFYISNRVDWNELAITSRYARRWDIEVWHREGKGCYGLKECGLRSGEAVSRYLTLSALAHNLLEIASQLSPVYAALVKRASTPGLRQRWVIIELVSQLISFATGMGNSVKKKIIDAILLPYRSTMNRRITDYC